jgi:TadE-like protein
MIELALVTPILLFILAAAADFGRAFYAYVAIENAAKEGALFGSGNPLCDDNTGASCGDPNNVVWHVRGELANQNLRNPDGSVLTPTIDCLAPNGTPHVSMVDCIQGDTYEVSLVYPFRLVTPILGSIIGNLNLATTARAVVFNLAFDPTPGVSVQKLVSPNGATNSAEIIAKCLEPDDHDSAGFYRSPCLDSSTANDQNDRISLRFEEGATIQYKLTVGNSGGQSLTSITVSDSTGSTGCAFPTTLAVGATATPCLYTRTAPVVTGGGITADFTNLVTVDSAQTLPATDRVTIAVDKPPARLRVLKWLSPFQDGDDGDGHPGFGTLNSVAVTYDAQIPGPFVWFKVIVTNTGGQTATGVQVADTHGALPYGQNSATAICDPTPASLVANASWQCRYKVALSSVSPASTNNTASATATNVVGDGDDSATATVQVSQCTGTNRTVPNLVGLNKAGATAAWTAAGFTGALTTWNGQPNSLVVNQTRPAFTCVAATSTMTASKDQT